MLTVYTFIKYKYLHMKYVCINSININTYISNDMKYENMHFSCKQQKQTKFQHRSTRPIKTIWGGDGGGGMTRICRPALVAPRGQYLTFSCSLVSDHKMTGSVISAFLIIFVYTCRPNKTTIDSFSLEVMGFFFWAFE